MYAAKKGLFEVTKTLVENGHAEVNIEEAVSILRLSKNRQLTRILPQENKWTALFFAMEGRHNDVLEYLLRCTKVDLTHRDKVRYPIVQ